jgi:uncharacterized membrane protein
MARPLPDHPSTGFRPSALLLLVLAALLLLGARVLATGRSTYVFLVWNLALALAPVPIGDLAVRALRGRSTFGLLIGATLAAVWLALFPNAPYLVTDFVHLHRRGEWSLHDVAMMASFAAAGWLAAVRSLLTWTDLPFPRDRRLGFVALSTVTGLAGFGIYLGRVHRLNSWDLATKPDEVLATLDRVLRLELPQAAAFASLFAVALATTTLLALRRS